MTSTDRFKLLMRSGAGPRSYVYPPCPGRISAWKGCVHAFANPTSQVKVKPEGAEVTEQSGQLRSAICAHAFKPERTQAALAGWSNGIACEIYGDQTGDLTSRLITCSNM